MVGADAPPRRQAHYPLPFAAALQGQEGVGGLHIPALADAAEGHRGPALEEGGQVLPEGADEALLGGQAHLLQGVGRGHRLAEDELLLRPLLCHLGDAPLQRPGPLHLAAPLLHPAADHLQFPDLVVDHRQLPPQGGDGAVQVVVFHVVPDLLQGEADFFQDQYGVQVVQLGGAVVAVAVVGVHIGRTEQADLVVEEQGLPGDALELGQFPHGK